MAFSSKRRGGLFTWTYLSYLDRTGRAQKAFIVPQEDPRFYEAFTRIYSLPELITGPVGVSERALSRAVKSTQRDDIIVTGATRKADSPPSWTGWRE